ncbi:MAG: Lipid II flippase FtsW [candidate division TM6 bacterium GW2011_GWF2_32_72]|nr:MAG: Lipid II flippase FtsW [candidate division TM6 bacterium GW2011_GWF2_32_72]
MFYTAKFLKSNLKIFLSIIASLIIIGLLFIYSSSSVYALEKIGSSFYFVKKQILGVIIGIIGLIIFRFLSLDFIKSKSPFLFFGSLFLTALTLVPKIGTRIHGSSRWLNIGGFAFQPSELLKIFLLIYVAYFLEKQTGRLHSFKHGYLPFLIILGITSLILLKQPDFGLTVTLCTTCFAMFFIAEFKPKHLLMTIGAALPIIGLLIALKPYRVKRVLTFLNPWEDPQGAGFQIIQSLIAIGTGSFWGTGISNSKQKFFYLPMQHTDFIFSIIAEETGFIGSVILITLYILFLYYGIKIATLLKNNFAIFVVLGFTILNSLQATINLFVATGMMPTKGIGLPFVSFGNSALVCNLCMVGLIINIVNSRQ